MCLGCATHTLSRDSYSHYTAHACWGCATHTLSRDSYSHDTAYVCVGAVPPTGLSRLDSLCRRPAGCRPPCPPPCALAPASPLILPVCVCLVQSWTWTSSRPTSSSTHQDSKLHGGGPRGGGGGSLGGERGEGVLRRRRGGPRGRGGGSVGCLCLLTPHPSPVPSHLHAAASYPCTCPTRWTRTRARPSGTMPSTCSVSPCASSMRMTSTSRER